MKCSCLTCSLVVVSRYAAYVDYQIQAHPSCGPLCLFTKITLVGFISKALCVVTIVRNILPKYYYRVSLAPNTNNFLAPKYSNWFNFNQLRVSVMLIVCISSLLKNKIIAAARVIYVSWIPDIHWLPSTPKLKKLAKLSDLVALLCTYRWYVFESVSFCDKINNKSILKTWRMAYFWVRPDFQKHGDVCLQVLSARWRDLVS